MEKKSRILLSITIGLMCFILIMTIFMQFKVVNQTQETNIDVMQETELRQELASWKNKYDETKAKYDETVAMLQTYKEETVAESDTRQTLEAELKTLEQALGKTDVEGEGVIITLTEKTEEELEEDEKFYAITSEDLLNIVNYLVDAGAEAISINGKRVINTTNFADIGSTIKMNGQYIRENDYVIKAIGNSTHLESSIFGKDGYAEILNTSGIKAEIEKSNKVQIEKYDGEYEIKYMKEAE